MANINWKSNTLNDAKDAKKAELNKRCNETIIGRFKAIVDGVTYQFSNDTEAQSNFKDTKLSFADGTIDTYLGGIVKWTAYDTDGNVVRLSLNQNQFNQVFIARLQHQNGSVSKLRDTLEPIIDQATTMEEVEAIVW